MARTEPKLSDLHPRLRERVLDLVRAHESAFPDRALCLIWGHRSTTEQIAAAQAGRSRIDPRRGRFGLHNYQPSLAADLWVYIEHEGTCETFFENRPARSLGLDLQLLKRGDFREFYLPLGKLAEMVGLEAGAMWRTLRDGPHVQLKKEDRIKALQSALNGRGFDCGEVDGKFGPKSRAAIEDAGHASGERWSVSRRQANLMPITPAHWRWLHEGIDLA